PNGVTFCQLKKIPPAAGQLGVICHTPGAAGPGGLFVGGAEPSPTRAAIIAAAAATPVAMPSSLAVPSGIAASELARAASRDVGPPTAAVTSSDTKSIRWSFDVVDLIVSSPTASDFSAFGRMAATARH